LPGLVVVLFGPVVVLSVPNEPSGNRLGSIVGGEIVPAGAATPALGAINPVEDWVIAMPLVELAAVPPVVVEGLVVVLVAPPPSDC
jgi:hypothetical protein